MVQPVINDCYSREEIEIAKFYKAFSHPARLAILRLLMNNDGYYVNEIVEQLPISQSSVSQHLKELKEIGIVNSEYQPPKIKYTFNSEIFKHFVSFHTDYFKHKIFNKENK
ncbi:MAG: winged helix-turn-helix transcriptional regulator [Bacteroidia bacterium]|nr:winged helix-turn-helix transcriptional regulator [Bacteroidia bacterium]